MVKCDNCQKDKLAPVILGIQIPGCICSPVKLCPKCRIKIMKSGVHKIQTKSCPKNWGNHANHVTLSSLDRKLNKDNGCPCWNIAKRKPAVIYLQNKIH